MSEASRSDNSAARRPLLRRALTIFLTLVLAFVAFLAVKIGPLFLAPNAYQSVPSIEGHPDFRNRALMMSAWAHPVARLYRAHPFEYQDNQSFCGPTSIANLLRSTGMDLPQHRVIEGTAYDPWFGILIGGLTLDEEARLLALRTRRPVGVVRGLTLAEFRHVIQLANDPRRRLIANFHRGPMFGRGHGHFSPVLAYLPERDLVLVGDVNSNYRPYLAPVERLWRAVDTVDDATRKKRGLLVVRVI